MKKFGGRCMRKAKVIAALLATVLLVGALSGCNAGNLSDLIDSVASQSTAKDGTDYIDYANEKRDEVIAEYVGDKLDRTASDALLDNVELTYYEAEDEEGVFEVYIDNSNQNYFFDGVVRLESDSKEYKINVYMLAPDNYEYFTLEVEGHPDDYLYYVEGDMYEFKDTLEEPMTLEYYETGVPNEVFCVIDELDISELDAKKLGEFFYKYDTLYNTDGQMTYYLATEELYNSTDEFVYDFFLNVDSEKREVTIFDADDNEVTSDTY